ncbi:MAG: hypothetical protein ACI9VR_000395 [Cognaticolwellia sp.]|jgi:hypothetical protein
MNMMLLLAGMACVIKPYGPAPEPAVTSAQAAAGQQAVKAEPQVDFSPYEKEFADLLNEGGVQDQDRLDRLGAAHNLSLTLRNGDPREPAVEAYLQAILEIEQRDDEQVIEEGFFTIGSLGEGDVLDEELAVEDDSGRPDTELGMDTGIGAEPSIALGDAQAQAREQLASGEYQNAMTTLEPFQEGPLWDSVTKALWKEAVDGFVRTERERAGEMFLAARDLPLGDARTRSLREVETVLVGLLTFYPESSYNEPIQQNLDMVRAELAG